MIIFFYYAEFVEMMGQGIPKVDELLVQNNNPEFKITDNQHQVSVVMYKK